jgi:hypothetical protein
MTNVVEVRYGRSGASQKLDDLGMRPMQARVWKAREAKHLLVKAPPASGKSRALMFVALDKLHHQGIAKAIVAVPERSIGASFDPAPLSQHGFFTDWDVAERWNLCVNENGGARGKVDALKEFLYSDDRTLVCTHSTLRFAYERFGAEAFDGCLLAIDEFHHAAADQDNKLGELVRGLLERNQVHIVAMTGSYFRGDQIAVMRPEDEDRFDRVTYTYYEQLDGYTHLKTLGIGYHFYRGRYLDAIGEVLDADKKTIIHIPNVNAAESVMGKYDEVNHILRILGEYESTDPHTGFLLVRQADGRILRVADLVDDNQVVRDKVVGSLRKAKDREAVDIIIALGMAKEGFDWIWCEHALTVGYRSSLTEVVQIIGRATRDAPGKSHSQFTNLIAEPLADQGAVVTAVNDMLKAITASLLMEQVMAPRFRFHPRPEEGGKDLGSGGQGTGMFFDEGTGEVHIAVKGLKEPSTDRVRMIVQEDLNDLLANVCQDPRIAARAIADDATAPEVVNQVLVPKVIEERYPYLEPEEVEEVREHLLAGMAVIAEVNRLELEGGADNRVREGSQTYDAGDPEAAQNGTARFIEMVRRFVNVADLSVDLIDSINPFQQAYEVLSKRMDAPTLAKIHGAIASQRVSMTEEEALALWPRIQRFRQEHDRPPNAASNNELEKRLGAALEWLKAAKRRRQLDAIVQAAS